MICVCLLVFKIFLDLKGRKGPNKKSCDMGDILALFHELGSNTPTFVALDLSKLPPVSVDYVDMSSMMKDIISMKADLTDAEGGQKDHQ